MADDAERAGLDRHVIRTGLKPEEQIRAVVQIAALLPLQGRGKGLRHRDKCFFAIEIDVACFGCQRLQARVGGPRSGGAAIQCKRNDNKKNAGADRAYFFIHDSHLKVSPALDSTERRGIVNDNGEDGGSEGASRRRKRNSGQGVVLFLNDLRQ
nr:hypothetical protein [Herbaspirillum rhizosphaerae]